MTYPALSDFSTGQPLSGWFVHRVSGRTAQVCATSGWALLRDLQETLQTRLSGVTRPSFDGRPITGSAVLINGSGVARGWDINLLRALWAIASMDRAPAASLAAIAADAQRGSGVISPATLAVGIWEANLSEGRTSTGATAYGLGSPGEVELPSNVVLPYIDRAPSTPTTVEGTSGLSCSAVGATPPGLAPAPTGGFIGFVTNPWVILGVIVVGVGATIALSRDVPVITPGLRTSRKNPYGRVMR